MLAISILSCIQIKSTIVDEDTFLGHHVNDPAIYSKPGNGTFLNPFNINTDNWGVGNIERLLLVEFKPLADYRTIELQMIERNDTLGALVILYFDKTKQADVYHTANLAVDQAMYANILNKTVVTEAEIIPQFEEVDGKLKASLALTDRFNNRIEMQIDEQMPEMAPVGLLAPIGGEAQAPKFMTLVFMKHFRFLSQKETGISVTINDQEVTLDKLPIKVNGIKGYQTKYSMEPVTVTWNINADTLLTPLHLSETDLCRQNDVEIACSDNEGHLEIERFSGIQKNHLVNFRFSPAVPDLQCLADGLQIQGYFVMGIDDVPGIIGGEYQISTSDSEVQFIVEPTEGYSPVPGKAWMKKMTWHAAIKKADGAFRLASQWIKD